MTNDQYTAFIETLELLLPTKGFKYLTAERDPGLRWEVYYTPKDDPEAVLRQTVLDIDVVRALDNNDIIGFVQRRF